MSKGSNVYQGPSGETYLFFRDHFNGSDVLKPLDVEFFEFKGFEREGKSVETKPTQPVKEEPKKEAPKKAKKIR